MPDVIVVGGGSAGCVAAATFADAGASVVILEAGRAFDALRGESDGVPELEDGSRMPVGPASPFGDSLTVSTTAGRSMVTTRGCVLGGSGAVNGGYFVRAPLSDFDTWPADRWNLDTVGNYYRRIENDLDFGDRAHHGSDGPVPVMRSLDAAVPTSFLRASVDRGLVTLDDLNAPDVGDGVGPVPSNVVRGRRVSMASAYLGTGRRDVVVRGGSRVARLVVFEGRVIGVAGRGQRADFVMYADRVVLAAGAVRTPALLLHSGIGPSEHLREVGIPVSHHLPGVGTGLADHPEVTVPYLVAGDPNAAVVGTPLQVVLHVGPVEIRPYTASFDRLIPGLPPLLPVVGVAHMMPLARGTIRVQSSDPFAPPRVRHRYLEAEGDRRALHEGVALARDIMASTEFTSAVGEVASRDDQVLAPGGSLHSMCSAHMGVDSDPTAVVDSACRVRGIEGLSIVDASMFPTPVSRGPHATVVMAARRAADLLVADAG